MSNEELPRSAEVASAYLDGELDAAERVAAAADPAVMAAVESFTRVRAALSEIDPVVASTRTAAMAAALAEFDVIHAPDSSVGAPAATATNVVSLQSRRMRAYRALTGVAAALVIGVVVVAALNSGSGDDKTASLATDTARAADTELPQPKIAAAETESAPSATESLAGAANSAAAQVPVIDTTDALKEFAASVEPFAATTAAPAATTAPAPNDQGAPAAGGYTSVPCLTSDQFVLGEIIFRGIPAVAVRDTATGSLQAIKNDDCRVLVEVESP